MACVLAKTRLEILILPDRPPHESYAFGFGAREQQHTVPDHAVAEKRRGAVEENQVEPIAPDLPAQHSGQTPDRVLDCRGIRGVIVVEKHRYVDIAFRARSTARPAPVQPGESHRAVALQCARKTAAEASDVVFVGGHGHVMSRSSAMPAPRGDQEGWSRISVVRSTRKVPRRSARLFVRPRPGLSWRDGNRVSGTSIASASARSPRTTDASPSVNRTLSRSKN